MCMHVHPCAPASVCCSQLFWWLWVHFISHPCQDKLDFALLMPQIRIRIVYGALETRVRLVSGLDVEEYESGTSNLVAVLLDCLQNLSLLWSQLFFKKFLLGIWLTITRWSTATVPTPWFVKHSCYSRCVFLNWPSRDAYIINKRSSCVWALHFPYWFSCYYHYHSVLGQPCWLIEIGRASCRERV